MSLLCSGGLVLDLAGQFFSLCWGASLSFCKFRGFVLLLLVFSSVCCFSFLFWPGGRILGCSQCSTTYLLCSLGCIFVFTRLLAFVFLTLVERLINLAVSKKKKTVVTF